jgi:DNA-directed RNA polymerase subunit RPC12/RpoP
MAWGTIWCSECGVKINIRKDSVGTVKRCPNCGYKFIVRNPNRGGCGCLILIILVAGLAYFFFRAGTSEPPRGSTPGGEPAAVPPRPAVEAPAEAPPAPPEPAPTTTPATVAPSRMFDNAGEKLSPADREAAKVLLDSLMASDAEYASAKAAAEEKLKELEAARARKENSAAVVIGGEYNTLRERMRARIRAVAKENPDVREAADAAK